MPCAAGACHPLQAHHVRHAALPRREASTQVAHGHAPLLTGCSGLCGSWVIAARRHGQPLPPAMCTNTCHTATGRKTARTRRQSALCGETPSTCRAASPQFGSPLAVSVPLCPVPRRTAPIDCWEPIGVASGGGKRGPAAASIAAPQGRAGRSSRLSPPAGLHTKPYSRSMCLLNSWPAEQGPFHRGH